MKTNSLLTDHRNVTIDKHHDRVTIGTWSSDVSVFGSIYDREYKFQTLKKVMSATGHKSGILGASYNCDGQS